ncbi:MAG: hypothetical protein ACK55J_02315, partial [Alphaproteobacteria bacterium]
MAEIIHQMLREAAAAGDVHLLKNLSSPDVGFCLTTADARSRSQECLRRAALGGHSDALRCLRDLYKLTADDARDAICILLT